MKRTRLIAKFLPLLFSIGAFAFFATFSPQVASAKAMTPAAGCWGVTCAGKDPTAMGCLSSVHFLPYKTPEYYQPVGSTTPVLVGDFSSVYSYTCNSNWNQAELNSYAISQGWRISTLISTVDSNNQKESISFPPQKILNSPSNGAGQVVPSNGAGQVVPSNGAGQVVPSNGAGQVVPSNGAGQIVPSNGAGQIVPSNGAGQVVPGSYGGETGWPTVSDMVDGTHQTASVFYLRDKNGFLLMTSPTVLQ